MPRSVAEVELDKLATLCGSLHLHCNSDDEIAGRLLEPIASALGADAAAYRHIRLQQPRPRIEKLTSIGVPASVADDYLAHFHLVDPFLARLHVQAKHSNFPDSGDGFEHYYHDFLYPNGLVHHTGFLLCDPRRQQAWVFNFHRPATAPAFSPLEHARSRLIETCLQGWAASAARSEAVRPETGKLSTLTSRESEVVMAVAQGHANKQIAAGLAISPRTVENHLRNIYEKLHVNTRTQLLSIVHREDSISRGHAPNK
jgi:DNA-binding CsgD family transcriptional regulator